MSALTGILAVSLLTGVAGPGITPMLAAHSDQFGQPAVAEAPALRGGTLAGTGIVTVQPQAAAAGELAATHADVIFNQIIVIPRAKALGFVVSDSAFSVEVWNAYRRAAKNMTGVSIAGAGGLTVPNPYGTPALFGPGQSRLFTATEPSAGPAAFSDVATFVFSGISGTDLTVTGTRLTPLPFLPDWNGGAEEGSAWLTQVLGPAFSEMEQRREMRSTPRPSFRLNLAEFDAQKAALLAHLIRGWQDKQFGLPFWPDAQFLAAPLAPGGVSISVANVALRPRLVNGGLILVWRSPLIWEAFTVSGISGTTLSLASPSIGSWLTTDTVVPLFVGRLPDRIDPAELNRGALHAAVELMGETGGVAVGGSFTQYLGFDVLELISSTAEAPQAPVTRGLFRLDPGMGAVDVQPRSLQPAGARAFNWYMGTRAACGVYDAFTANRRGRSVPFWLSTGREDLVLAADIGSSDTQITIKACDYTRFSFPTKGRNHLCVTLFAGPTYRYRKVLAAVDNGDGTETLTLDSSLGIAAARATSFVSYLNLYRFDTDDPRRQWRSRDAAEASIPLRELPLETP